MGSHLIVLNEHQHDLILMILIIFLHSRVLNENNLSIRMTYSKDFRLLKIDPEKGSPTVALSHQCVPEAFILPMLRLLSSKAQA